MYPIEYTSVLHPFEQLCHVEQGAEYEENFFEFDAGCIIGFRAGT